MMRKNKDQLALDLKYFLNGGNSFNCLVFLLISKSRSTPTNRDRLQLGFSDYIEIWEEWEKSIDENIFFEKYNVNKNWIKSIN